MADEELDALNINLDAQNVTVDNFYQAPVTPNTQGESENTKLTGERPNNSDALSETLKGWTINDAGYYDSDKNDTKGDPAIHPKVATHTSDGKKRKVTDTRRVIDCPSF